MVIKKVKKIIRKKLYEYPIYDRLINELELEKDTTEGRRYKFFNKKQK